MSARTYASQRRSSSNILFERLFECPYVGIMRSRSYFLFYWGSRSRHGPRRISILAPSVSSTYRRTRKNTLHCMPADLPHEVPWFLAHFRMSAAACATLAEVHEESAVRESLLWRFPVLTAKACLCPRAMASSAGLGSRVLGPAVHRRVVGIGWRHAFCRTWQPEPVLRHQACVVHAAC